jgi:hypothetical protein
MKPNLSDTQTALLERAITEHWNLAKTLHLLNREEKPEPVNESQLTAYLRGQGARPGIGWIRSADERNIDAATQAKLLKLAAGAFSIDDVIDHDDAIDFPEASGVCSE